MMSAVPAATAISWPFSIFSTDSSVDFSSVNGKPLDACTNGLSMMSPRESMVTLSSHQLMYCGMESPVPFSVMVAHSLSAFDTVTVAVFLPLLDG